MHPNQDAESMKGGGSHHGWPPCRGGGA